MMAYTVLLVLVSCAVIAAGAPGLRLWDALYWVPLIAVANLSQVSTLPQLELDATLDSVVIVAAALLHDPAAVVLFVFVGELHWRELRRQAPLVMALFNRAMVALSGGCAAVGAAFVYDLTGGQSWQIIPAAFIAITLFDGTNTVLLATMLVIRRGRSWREALGHAANPFPRFALNTGVSAMLSLLVAVLVRDVSRWAVVLIAIPMWLSYSAQQSARRAEDRAEELADRVRELETLNALSGALLSVRTARQIPDIVAPALERALATPGVMVDLAGTSATTDAARVTVVGAEPAAIVVPGGVDDRATAVVEASAALVGLALTRLRLEAELAETERARTALTGRILEEATHERSRIALGVHDDVVPLFAAAQMKIDMLDVTLERDPSRAGQLIDDALHAVTDGISRLRDTLEALRRSTLVPGTLRDGVGRLLAELQSSTGVRTTLEAPEPLPALPFAVELVVFETIRGGLANVEKHAAATTLLIRLDADDGKLVVLMQDDGRGFDPAAVGERSHGLALMRQRAELARGRFDISTTSGEGTTVRLEVPTW